MSCCTSKLCVAVNKQKNLIVPSQKSHHFIQHGTWWILAKELVSYRKGRTSSKNHVNQLHPILRYAKSLWRFTEIKQVNACSIQVCRGFVNAWNTCSKGRTFLHCQKVWEIPEYGWAHLSCRENCMLPIVEANQSACFSFSTVSYSRKLHEKYSIRTAVCGVRQFHSLPHQIAECTWSCPTYPLWSTMLQVSIFCFYVTVTFLGPLMFQ